MERQIASLLEDISQESPGGIDIEYEPIYGEIRQLRESDPDYLPEDEWATELKVADWPQVEKKCIKVLTERSKDFTIVCWLWESWVHLYGLQGVAAGCSLLSQSIEKYWQNGFPPVNEDGEHYRYAKFNWLAKQLVAILPNIQLLSHKCSTFKLWKARSAMSLADCDDSSTRDELVAFNAWISANAVNEPIIFDEKISQCVIKIESLQILCNEVSGNEELVSFAELLEMLADIKSFVINQVGEHVYSLDPKELLSESDVPVAHEHSAMNPIPAVAMSRESAISSMNDIAKYFREKEPSSPVPYLMERAVRWANMSLDEWLQEMVQDSSCRENIYSILDGKIND